MPSLPVILRSNATKDLKGKCKIEDDFIFRDPFDCAARKLGLPKIAAERDFWEEERPSDGASIAQNRNARERARGATRDQEVVETTEADKEQITSRCSAVW